MNFVIKERFANIFPLLSDIEFEALEKSILEFGFTDSVKVGSIQGVEEIILLDGHNRNKVKEKHLDNSLVQTSFKVQYLKFESEDHAEAWVRSNQACRRNLNRNQESLNRVRLKRILDSNDQIPIPFPNISENKFARDKELTKWIESIEVKTEDQTFIQSLLETASREEIKSCANKSEDELIDFSQAFKKSEDSVSLKHLLKTLSAKDQGLKEVDIDFCKNYAFGDTSGDSLKSYQLAKKHIHKVEASSKFERVEIWEEIFRNYKENPAIEDQYITCLLYTSPSPRDQRGSRMPSSA